MLVVQCGKRTPLLAEANDVCTTRFVGKLGIQLGYETPTHAGKSVLRPMSQVERTGTKG